MDKFPLTKDGFTALEAELKHLKGVDRPNIIAAIALEEKAIATAKAEAR